MARGAPGSNGAMRMRAVSFTLVGGTGDQLQEKSRFQNASHWPFSLRERAPQMAEGEPVFTVMAEGNRGPMAHFVANRCHT